MKLKVGCSGLNDIKTEIWYALGVAEGIIAGTSAPTMVVTSLVDGQHKQGSLHYVGRAADIRTHDFTEPEKQRVFQALRLLLDKRGFDVVLESDHIHMEYDPKTGESISQGTTY